MSAASSLQFFPPPVLVDRERERDTLRARLAGALAGRGGLVLIGGEAGIGKTALAEALCREAEERGALVLVGRCYDLTETPPYGPWVELFGRYRPTDGDPSLPAAFTERGTVGAVASQTALFRQVEDFVAALATSRPEGARPVVLLLDDLHWADPASLDLLRSLARSLATLPLLLVATYRSDELTRRHPLAQLLPLLVREAGAARLDLRPLDDPAIRTLIAARYRLADADTERLVAYLQGRAEGNALFLGELLRALEETGALRFDGAIWRVGDLYHTGVPQLLRQVIDARLARLDEESQRLLAIAAVIGHEVPLAIWSVVGAADEAAVLAAAERGLEAHLLIEAPSGERVQFAHALIREALYESIPAIRRRHPHLRAADALIASFKPDPDAVAWHLQQAGDPRAVSWLMEAGERAQRAWAWLAAADRFEAALALMGDDTPTASERGWLTFRLALLRRYGDPERALVHLDAAGQFAAEIRDTLLGAQVRFRRGQIRNLRGGDVRAGLDEMAAGIALLEALPPVEVAAKPGIALVDITEARVGYYSHLGFNGHFAEAQALGERVAAEAAAAAADGVRSIRYGMTVAGLARVYAFLGKADEARQLSARMSSAWCAIDFPLQVAIDAMFRLIWETLPYRADDIAERRRVVTEAEEAWTRGSGGRAAMPDRFARIPVLFVEGEWDEARALALAGYRESAGYAVSKKFALSTLVPLAAAQGDRDLAGWLIEEWLPEGPATPPGSTFFGVTILQRMAAALALDAGDLATARAWLEAHDRWFAWSGAVLGQAERHLAWAHYHRAANDMTTACQHAARALIHANEPRQPLALLAVHRMLGELETDAGRYDDAARHLRASLTLTEACDAPYERALTLLADAALRAETGERDTAIHLLLKDVRPIFASLGAQPALARAEALIARLDGAPKPAPVHPAGLSAREVDVLRLVADGLSNADIAERLFLSTRTVQVHVAHILQKTGAENRAGAAAFALRHGLA